MSLEIDPKTKAAINELFAGKVCSHCGHPAQRVRSGPNRGDVYYCADCLPEGQGHRVKQRAEQRSRQVTVRLARSPRFSGKLGAATNRREDL